MAKIDKTVVDESGETEAPIARATVHGVDFDGNRAATKAKLDAQPKRKIRLRQAAPGEPQLPDEIVGVNGYNYLIMRGVDVSVPQTVYDILDEAHRI